VGAAEEEEQRGREEATIEHAFDSILIIPAPSLPLPVPAGRCRLPRRRGDTWRGERGERQGRGAGRYATASEGGLVGKEAEGVGRL